MRLDRNRRAVMRRRRRLGGAGAAPPAPAVFAHEIVTAAGSSTISAMNGLRVRIDGGSWQSLSAAGLTISRTAADELTVAGFAGTETTVEYTYQQEIPGEPNSAAGTYDDGLFTPHATSLVTPQLSVFPGFPISQSADGEVVTAT